MKSFFEETVRIQGLTDEKVRAEFGVSKHNALKVVKTYAYFELKDEIENRENDENEKQTEKKKQPDIAKQAGPTSSQPKS